jgi:hypothetical protein
MKSQPLLVRIQNVSAALYNSLSVSQNVENTELTYGPLIGIYLRELKIHVCDKARAHKEGMRIGKTPKKLDSICCPQCRETKADTLKN